MEIPWVYLAVNDDGTASVGEAETSEQRNLVRRGRIRLFGWREDMPDLVFEYHHDAGRLGWSSVDEMSH